MDGPIPARDARPPYVYFATNLGGTGCPSVMDGPIPARDARPPYVYKFTLQLNTVSLVVHHNGGQIPAGDTRPPYVCKLILQPTRCHWLYINDGRSNSGT